MTLLLVHDQDYEAGPQISPGSLFIVKLCFSQATSHALVTRTTHFVKIRFEKYLILIEKYYNTALLLSHKIHFEKIISSNRGFPDSSVSKESACNVGDPGSVSG